MELIETEEHNIKTSSGEFSLNLNNSEPSIKNDNNMLVSAAMPLLSLFISTKKTKEHSEVENLRSQFIKQIRNFEAKAKLAGYSARIILASRYCLCTALDEAALGTTWGRNSVWTQQSLLALLHNETWGGERFYIILEKMLEDSRTHIELLELIYLILSLGFEGKYYNNRPAREEILATLFRIITTIKPSKQKLLSPHAETDVLSLKNQHGTNLFWKLTAIILTILTITAFFLENRLSLVAKPLIAQANEISASFLLENVTKQLGKI